MYEDQSMWDDGEFMEWLQLHGYSTDRDTYVEEPDDLYRTFIAEGRTE